MFIICFVPYDSSSKIESIFMYLIHEQNMDSLLGDTDSVETLRLTTIIFTVLCFINVPLAFFYSTLFLCCSRVSKYNQWMYDTFIIISLSILAYFVILYISLQVCSDVITYNGRFPLFYML